MLLRECELNKPYIIQSIKSIKNNYQLQLFSRGFVSGMKIQVLSKGNIMIVKVLNTTYGLNADIYNNIFVKD